MTIGEPEKAPKQKSIKELMAIEKTGADLTPEETDGLWYTAVRKPTSREQGGRERKATSRKGKPVRIRNCHLNQ